MVKNINGKIKKIIIVTIIFIMTFVPISNASPLDDILTQGDNFLNEGAQNGGTNLINQNSLKAEINSLYNILLTIGVALSVLVGAILGIKYMISSVEEQAKIKETLVPYALGCLVVFGAFGIWKIIITLGQEIF